MPLVRLVCSRTILNWRNFVSSSSYTIPLNLTLVEELHSQISNHATLQLEDAQAERIEMLLIFLRFDFHSKINKQTLNLGSHITRK